MNARCLVWLAVSTVGVWSWGCGSSESDGGGGGSAGSAGQGTGGSSGSASGGSSGTASGGASGSASGGSAGSASGGSAGTSSGGSAGSASGGASGSPGDGGVDCKTLNDERAKTLAAAVECSGLLGVVQCSGSDKVPDQCGCPVIVNEAKADAVKAAKAAYDAWEKAGCGPFACGAACFDAKKGICDGTTSKCVGVIN